jgi:ketosteroid isomerase-like protein
MYRIILGIPLLFAVTPAFADTRSDIEKANRQFEQVFARGDAKGLAQLYTENATMMPPGAPAQKGQAAIEQFSAGMMKAGSNEKLTLMTDSVEDYGKATREIGHFTLDMNQANGQPVHVEGKYVVVWKQEGGGWKLDSDIWNTDK